MSRVGSISHEVEKSGRFASWPMKPKKIAEVEMRDRPQHRGQVLGGIGIVDHGRHARFSCDQLRKSLLISRCPSFGTPGEDDSDAGAATLSASDRSVGPPSEVHPAPGTASSVS